MAQPPRRASSSAGSSAHAIPAGVAALHSNQMTEMVNKIKGIHFKYSCIIHQNSHQKTRQVTAGGDVQELFTSKLPD